MQTSQVTNIRLAATDRTSFYEWRGKTRIEVEEIQGVTVRIEDINTEEVLRGLHYYLRSLAQDSDKSETSQRILGDILTSLKENLKTKAEV